MGTDGLCEDAQVQSRDFTTAAVCGAQVRACLLLSNLFPVTGFVCVLRLLVMWEFNCVCVCMRLDRDANTPELRLSDHVRVDSLTPKCELDEN